MTKKQKEEIEYLSNEFNPTENELKEYIDWTVNGIKNIDWRKSKNRIFHSKRWFDMFQKEYRKQLRSLDCGIVGTIELFRDEPSKYYQKIIEKIINQEKKFVINKINLLIKNVQ